MGGVDIREPAHALDSAAVRAAPRSPGIERMARYGLVAKGVSFGLDGVLRKLGQTGYGPVLLFVVAEARYRRG
jgi:hypothetical protein